MTVRTLSELNALFPSDGQQSISGAEVRDAFDSQLVHGTIGRVNNGTPANFDDTPSVLPLNQELHSRHLVVDVSTTFSMTTPAPLTTARYNVAYALNVQGQAGGGNAGDYIVGAYADGSLILGTENMFTVEVDRWEVIYWRLVGTQLANNISIDLRVYRPAGSGDLLIRQAVLTVERTGLE